MRILVADDEIQIRELLREALKMKGHDVISVPTAEQALFEIVGKPFDLAILDLSIQGSGNAGASILEELRAARNKLPIIIYSGELTPEKEIALRRAGADEVLQKNIGIDTLLRQIEKVAEAKAMPAPAKPGEKRVLVVDDDRHVRNVLALFFKERGFKVEEAENGMAALEAVKFSKPSIVLLDLHMPGLDGIDTLKKMLEIDPKLPVIMITGHFEDHQVQEAIQLGAYNYVLKPFDFLYLEVVVLSRLTIASS